MFPWIISNQWMSAEYGLKNMTLKEGVIPVWITIVIHENIKTDKLFPYFRVEIQSGNYSFVCQILICCWWKKCVFDFLKHCMKLCYWHFNNPFPNFCKELFFPLFWRMLQNRIIVNFFEHKWEFFPFSCVSNISTLNL